MSILEYIIICIVCVLFGTFGVISLYMIITEYYKSYIAYRDDYLLTYYNRKYEHMYEKYDLCNKGFDAYKVLNLVNRTRSLRPNEMEKVLEHLYITYDPEYRDEIIDNLLEED